MANCSSCQAYPLFTLQTRGRLSLQPATFLPSAPTGRNVPARGERSETPGSHTSTRPKGATMSAPAGRNVPARGERSVTPGSGDSVHPRNPYIDAPAGRYHPRLEGAPSVTRGETPGYPASHTSPRIRPSGAITRAPAGRNVPARGERSVTPGKS